MIPEAQVANITEDIRNGNTGYLNDFLNAIISEGVREGITDIFGQGVEIENSEAVQTARRVKELLDKLAEYKPLAKIEELEEQNYNMIDGCVNNNPKKPRIIGNRISVLDRLHIKLEERKQKGQPQQQRQQERSRKN